MKKSNGFKVPLQSQLGFLIKRVQQAFRARMDEALSKNGLTTSQYAVLCHLCEENLLSNAELARRSFVTAPTMIRIVRDLEDLGFIEKTDSKAHRKVIDVALTEKGGRVLLACEMDVQSIQLQMLSSFSKTEVAQLSRLLISCAKNLEGAV
ncbi:MAG: MarR family transcriptional regulator [Bacteriovorax sp.]|nr:MarR family transcriptional regulator [Bacteriovorax sp.]